MTIISSATTALPHYSGLPADTPRCRLTHLLRACGQSISKLTGHGRNRADSLSLAQQFRSMFRPLALSTREMEKLERHNDIWDIKPQRVHGARAQAFLNQCFLPRFMQLADIKSPHDLPQLLDVLQQLPMESRAQLDLSHCVVFSRSVHAALANAIVNNRLDHITQWSSLLELFPPAQLPHLESLLCLPEYDQKLLDFLVEDNASTTAYKDLRLQLRSALASSGQASAIPVPEFTVAVASVEQLLAEILQMALHGTSAPIHQLEGWLRQMSHRQLELLPADWNKVLFATDSQGNCRVQQGLEQGQSIDVWRMRSLMQCLPDSVLQRLRPPPGLLLALELAPRFVASDADQRPDREERATEERLALRDLLEPLRGPSAPAGAGVGRMAALPSYDQTEAPPAWSDTAWQQ